MSRIEGSNPSLTAKFKKTDFRVGFFAFRQTQTPMPTSEPEPRSGGSSTLSPSCLQSPDGTSELFALPAPTPYLAFVIAQPDKRSFLSQQEQQDDCNAILWPQHAFFYGRYPAPIIAHRLDIILKN
ncbi:MAG: hypothetical protein ACRDAR_10810 [Aeromonas veronii]